MLRFYADKGLPAGPFADPANVFTTPTGRGKIHLSGTCKPGLVSARKVLWDVPKSAYCSQCANHLGTLPPLPPKRTAKRGTEPGSSRRALHLSLRTRGPL